MTRRVRLDAALTATQRDAHRNALLTLPRAFEIVESDEDVVVTRPGATPGLAVQVVAGVPLASDGPGAIAATVVDWDPVVAEFVSWIDESRDRLVGVHVAVWTIDGEKDHLLEGMRLASLLAPSGLGAEWRETSVGSTVIASLTGESQRVAVSAGTGVPGGPRLEARVIGHGFSAELSVATGVDARRSEAWLTTPSGIVGAARPYSSAFRRLWLSLAEVGK